jgi:hypothetical protein
MAEPDVTRAAREQRFTALFSECYAPVLAFARRRLEPDAAQDVVAETFLTAWRLQDRITGEPLPWLYRIAGHAGTGPADPPKNSGDKKANVKPADTENVVQMEDPLPAGSVFRFHRTCFSFLRT